MFLSSPQPLQAQNTLSCVAPSVHTEPLSNVLTWAPHRCLYFATALEACDRIIAEETKTQREASHWLDHTPKPPVPVNAWVTIRFQLECQAPSDRRVRVWNPKSTCVKFECSTSYLCSPHGLTDSFNIHFLSTFCVPEFALSTRTRHSQAKPVTCSREAE